MVTESFSFSSNLTVAAEWKTIETLLKSMAYDKIGLVGVPTDDLGQVVLTWSFSEMPSSGEVMSPHIGMTLFRSLGRSLRIESNSCNKAVGS